MHSLRALTAAKPSLERMAISGLCNCGPYGRPGQDTVARGRKMLPGHSQAPVCSLGPPITSRWKHSPAKGDGRRDAVFATITRLRIGMIDQRRSDKGQRVRWVGTWIRGFATAGFTVAVIQRAATRGAAIRAIKDRQQPHPNVTAHQTGVRWDGQ